MTMTAFLIDALKEHNLSDIDKASIEIAVEAAFANGAWAGMGGSIYSPD